MNKIIFFHIFYFIIFILDSSLISTQIFESYGFYTIKYYDENDSDCLNKSISETIINVDNITERCIESENYSIYLANWKPFSNSLGYKLIDNCDDDTLNELEEEEFEEDDEDGSFLCNGFCAKDKFTKKKYVCLYNNIIKTANITLTLFDDKKCKKEIITKVFNNECVNFESYSILPLNWKDEKKYLYYKFYTNHTDCYGENINITESYLLCNKKCHKTNIKHLNQLIYYKCEFSKENFLFLKKILLFLLLIIL